jgi:pyruvate carboxylase subunit B
MSRKTLKIRDLTLRDGQQSLFATRMSQEQVDKTLPYFKEAHFYAMEVWGGAVPDSIMRFLNEDPWNRLKKIKEGIGEASKLTALSRGRNLFGYNPYPEWVIEGFIKNAIADGVDILRIFDALNDLDNCKSSVEYCKKYGAIADGAICYTVDPVLEPKNFFDKILHRKQNKIFTTDYFVKKAKTFESMGANMVTLKDMAGLVTPKAAYDIISAFKKELSIPVDFHSHSTPGYGLASTLSAIIAGTDIIDTNIFPFAGGPAATAFEIVYLFCKKLDIDVNVNIEVIPKLQEILMDIRRELKQYDQYPNNYPKMFDPNNPNLPLEIEKLFDQAIELTYKNKFEKALEVCQQIEAYFNFPPPNEAVKNAQIPGGMYTNMLTQLQQLNLEHLLPKVLKAVPKVRIDAGCVPLVTPTSQIIGVQAVNCILDEKKGLPWYTTKSTQFIKLIEGAYGKTPIPIDPKFRKFITGSETEKPFDTSTYLPFPNKEFPEYGNRKLYNNEKEQLLLELFPNVAEEFLRKRAEQAYKKEIEEALKEKELEENKKRQALLREKEKYEKLSPEEKEKRLLYGLYNYWSLPIIDTTDDDDLIETEYYII